MKGGGRTPAKLFFRFSWCLLALACFPADARPEAPVSVDTEALTASLHKSLSPPPAVQMKILEVATSPISGLYRAAVEMRLGQNVRREVVFVSSDSRYYIVGNLFDVTVDMDAVRKSRIDLAGAPFRGREGAPVTVVEYSDLECSACKNTHETLAKEKFWDKYGKKIKFVYKHFPISRSHAWAARASIGVLCAGRQDPQAYWRMIDRIYAEQNLVTEEGLKSRLLQLAAENGLDAGPFESCYDKQETLFRVQADLNEGTALGIFSTPTFVVNGRVLVGFRGSAELRQVIDEFLARK